MSFLAKPNVCRRCIQNLRTVAQLKTFPIAFNRRRQPYSVKHAQQDGRPFRMAVIGSGPAGFYTAYKVMSQIDNTTIDMYEHLPVPFGLVRYGVAPDHPEVKVDRIPCCM
jgi:adrenodoxin-NADP+ reductase